MREEHINGLAAASLVFGILAILGSVLVLPTAFNAGLAITFAWLSRGDGRMCGRAVAGNILGVVSIILSIIALIALIYAGIRYAQSLVMQIPMDQVQSFIDQIVAALEQNGVTPEQLEKLQPFLNQFGLVL